MERLYWIFDMDGTVTIPVHDFDAMRRVLGLPKGKPILEEIATRPQEQSEKLYAALDEMEYHLAKQAAPQAGAEQALQALCHRRGRVGIFTRNSQRCAWETLRRCRLDRFFQPTDVVTREECAPKPNPQGIHLLLYRWKATAQDAVMVGDYLFDMLSGRKAGVATVGFNGHGAFQWHALADYIVSGFPALLDLPIFPRESVHP